ncbi:hypothetical protein [Klebsiella phage UPM 2146]|uniref:Uncharacterized protein n=1 Tax=Klebsiella phage UPM 2146 TaxID=2847816 RepID=A0A5Q2F624_9CAUD|nr:hypothetical protein HYQ02_gp181 [Klebsiella phage UPM 2146]QGF20678.1 hypothetical protein [Klebsiella phage UPM 2146]
MSDKEIDIRAIEMQGAKKYIVGQIEEAEKELRRLKSGIFSSLMNSKSIFAVEVYKDTMSILLDDINKKIARHIPNYGDEHL